jgi:hypothetical protein
VAGTAIKVAPMNVQRQSEQKPRPESIKRNRWDKQKLKIADAGQLNLMFDGLNVKVLKIQWVAVFYR